jgi:hypothetical protein
MKTEEGSSGEEFHLRPYTPKELRTLYGVSWLTFTKWIKPFELELGKVHGRCFTVKQVKLLIDKLGIPENLKL